MTEPSAIEMQSSKVNELRTTHKFMADQAYRAYEAFRSAQRKLIEMCANELADYARKRAPNAKQYIVRCDQELWDNPPLTYDGVPDLIIDRLASDIASFDVVTYEDGVITFRGYDNAVRLWIDIVPFADIVRAIDATTPPQESET